MLLLDLHSIFSFGTSYIDLFDHVCNVCFLRGVDFSPDSFPSYPLLFASSLMIHWTSNLSKHQELEGRMDTSKP